MVKYQIVGCEVQISIHTVSATEKLLFEKVKQRDGVTVVKTVWTKRTGFCLPT